MVIIMASKYNHLQFTLTIPIPHKPHTIMAKKSTSTKVAKAKTKRIKADKVTPKVARIQRQLGASLLPW